VPGGRRPTSRRRWAKSAATTACSPARPSRCSTAWRTSRTQAPSWPRRPRPGASPTTTATMSTTSCGRATFAGSRPRCSTPSTTGSTGASELPHDSGEHVAASHLRAVADYWNDRVEAWCSMPSGQYVRLASDPDHRPTEGAIAPEFLELVRYGLRRPKDDRVLRSLQGVDTSLKVSLPAGPSWRRVGGGASAEQVHGAPCDA